VPVKYWNDLTIIWTDSSQYDVATYIGRFQYHVTMPDTYLDLAIALLVHFVLTFRLIVLPQP
jgi:hypothetical protein